jgi:TRAP-type C4-dicarboxylate transport system permease small subunit
MAFAVAVVPVTEQIGKEAHEMTPNFKSDGASTVLSVVVSATDRFLWRVERGTMIVACLAVFAIMVLIFLDAALRYLINSPIKFTVDVVTLYLLSAGIVLVSSYTLRQGGHVSVELFADMMPKRVYQFLVGLALLASAFVVGVMAFQTSKLTLEAIHNKELMVGLYAFPMGPSKGLVAFGLSLATLRIIHAGLSNLLAALTNNPSLAWDISHAADVAESEGI